MGRKEDRKKVNEMEKECRGGHTEGKTVGRKKSRHEKREGIEARKEGRGGEKNKSKIYEPKLKKTDSRKEYTKSGKRKMGQREEIKEGGREERKQGAKRRTSRAQQTADSGVNKQ